MEAELLRVVLKIKGESSFFKVGLPEPYILHFKIQEDLPYDLPALAFCVWHAANLFLQPGFSVLRVLVVQWERGTGCTFAPAIAGGLWGGPESEGW